MCACKKNTNILSAFAWCDMLVLDFVLIQHLSFYYETAPYASGLYFTVVALVSFALHLHHFEFIEHMVLLMFAKLYIYFYHKKLGGNCQPDFRVAS